ncbi:hypothetical protein [Streptomyces uncialis]|uniref:Lipoprotein n=1 Tax=Streptomyces uncialis TaxID=1048205 RepID=A0A1Q4V390_9ACTN|nr:hypothetical protein [Streptomyces uncialis]OKH92317.1 hypothetical protein AB852_25745 [Streptomyces uncialis]
MTRSSTLWLRSTAVALAASACLVGGVTSTQAAPAAPGSTHQYGKAVPEVRTFTGTGMGVYPSHAVNGAVRMAFTIAQSAGWQANQCHVRATDVRPVSGGMYTAVADLFCQR